MKVARTISLSLLLIVGSCSQPATPPASIHGTREAIAKMWLDHIDAAKRKDAGGVAAMYTDDAVYIVGQQEVRGRPAIDRMEAEGLANADVIDAKHTSHDVQVFGNVAYEIGTVEGPVRVQGQDLQTVTFHFMAQWARGDDGTWRMRHLIGQ